MADATSREVIAFIEAYAAVVAEHKRELTKLDSAIGDADHGENLDRGFKAALERMPGEDATPAEVLKATAMALVSKVGGAAGPLYGTGFLRAAAAIDGREELDTAGIVEALDAGLAGVITRGKTELEDKTMVDAWSPAVDAAKEALDRGAECSEVLASAAAAAEEGMRATIPLVARKGRASYLGERSAGHQDPGATSTYYLFQTLADRAGSNE